ncbi:hypothetical protein M436DRAFT_79248 [Aureobasidium namibiae CBS 147.97]|uniref:Uncharacterized protein n=1 Tax=Aureobasidium namibiae CBS 147.97 TaxID=1043004 RepID=A0A074X1S0_9PEZI
MARGPFRIRDATIDEPSTVLQTVTGIKTSLDKIKSTPAVSTPDSSTSGDIPAESKTATLPVCKELIAVGLENILEDILEKLLELSTQGDVAAGIVFRFFEDHCDDKATMGEFGPILWKAVDENPEFICEFTTRTRKMAIDFFTRKSHEVLAEGLVEKLSNM